jgi:two-component system, OmpR family, phosphate regulon sensor histidine kinase PhoR
MRLGIRARLLLVAVVLIGAAFFGADTYLTRGLERQLRSRVTDDLFARAELVAERAESARLAPADTPGWEALARALGAGAHARVTLVRDDGAVLGDSSLDAVEPAGTPSLASRPEASAALHGGRGENLESVAPGRRMLSVAVRFGTRDGHKAAASIASPLDSVDGMIRQLRRIVAVASLCLVGLALLISTLASRWISPALRDLTLAARRMAEGDLDVRTHVPTSDELGELAAALDQLGASVGATLDNLRHERDLQGRILDGMQEGVLVLDRDGRLVMMNPALRQMLLLGADAKGKLLIEVVRHAELHELVKRARVGRTTAMGEVDLPGIKPRRLLTHATALAGEAGGLLAVCVDVTDLRRLESLRRDFVANVSHELRTPVTAVRSAAETLQVSALKDPDPAVAMRFVEIIERNAERLQSLIEDLLELSRLESKEFKLKKERIDLGTVSSIVFGLFRQRADKKGIRLSADLPSDLPLLQTDQRALEQVLSNLVENAVKYCPPGSVVSIGASVDPAARSGDGVVRVTVSDNGPGVDPKHVPRLFERFYRVDAGRSRDVGGTGLGLSIVKHLVEAMGGSVTVDSKVGRGSTFAVTVPSVGARA